MASGSLAKNSMVKQSGVGRAAQKAAASGQEPEVEKASVHPTAAQLPPPIPKDDLTQTADYYRYGKKSTDAVEQNFGELEIPRRRFEPFSEGGQGEASIRIRGKDAKEGTDAEFRDYIPAYTKFFLNSVNETHQERSQIIETFGDFYVFLFNERPPMYSFNGVLMNARNANWVQDFMYYYDNFLRGTKCAEIGAKAILTYGGRQVEGFILQTSNQTRAATEGGVQFNFNMVVTRRRYLGFSEDFGFATRGPDGNLIKDEDFRKILESVAGAEGKGTSDPETSKSINFGEDTLKGAPAKGLVSGVGTGIA